MHSSSIQNLVTELTSKDGRRIIIRKYRPEDREGVRLVCSETGFLGRPQEAFFIGRDVFADLWSKYWTDYEPESAFVAESGGKVAGYLLGCLDTRRQLEAWRKEILPRVGRRLIGRSWWKHRVNRRWAAAMIKCSLRREFDLPMQSIIREYPAHLHTNIADPALRGAGAGKAMMHAYFDYLCDNGVPGVHLGTTSHNRRAVRFYRRMGFEVVSRDRLTLYDHAIDDPPLFMLLMGRKL